MANVVAAVALGLVVLLNLVATIMLARSDFETLRQKLFQLLFVWVVPFVGSIIVIAVNRGAPADIKPRADAGAGGDNWLAGIGPQQEAFGDHHGSSGDGNVETGNGGDAGGGGH